MKKILPVALVLSIAATSACARQPAEIVQLGSKFYGRDGNGQPLAYRPSAAPAQYNNSNSQVISTSDSAGSVSASSGSGYYDNNTYQAIGDTSISVKDNTPAVASGDSASSTYYPSVSAKSETVTPQVSYNDKVAVSGGQKLRWKSGATELEKNYYEQDRLSAKQAESSAPETLPETAKVEVNPLQGALEEEVNQLAKVAPAPAEPEPIKNITKEKEPAAPTKLSKFIWPARGKVISRFGAEESGVKNDGISIALPEGTSIQAASGGTVIYVGDELEGFGNLVIVRHSDNWVTAYGHNQKAMVKRGDKVAQGQVIALSGETGNVTKPQLYFSIRKGKEPMDPLKLLEENNSLGKGKLDIASGELL